MDDFLEFRIAESAGSAAKGDDQIDAGVAQAREKDAATDHTGGTKDENFQLALTPISNISITFGTLRSFPPISKQRDLWSGNQTRKRNP